jgi:hypothetical protein
VLCSDPRLVELWDRHDWKSLFHAHADTWGRSIRVHVFGHALLELALDPARYLVAKAVLLMTDDVANLATDAESLSRIDRCLAQRIEGRSLLLDPQHLRPLPLSGVPGWHVQGGSEDFFDARSLFSSPCAPGACIRLPIDSEPRCAKFVAPVRELFALAWGTLRTARQHSRMEHPVSCPCPGGAAQCCRR